MNVINTIVDFLKNWKDVIEIVITLLTIPISIIAYFKASKANKLQNKINEIELKLKQYEQEKMEKEKEEANSSCVEARVVTIGKGKHRMKVWNSGNTTVYNVSARFDGDVGIVIMDREKQPFEELEPGSNYELVVITYDLSIPKFKIITEWEDQNGEKHSKEQMRDLQS
ncbi:hypothetical protein [Ruminococcus sp. XPD3002]|uniref:hypothetical protein n=1 Tax=Ruminococcus sp. XPD3002 TaxID=1452269 RepID=UPI000916F0B4|nr:hypothetical protein SAMN04487832_12119 [Ruminococcus flavefaciens]